MNSIRTHHSLRSAAVLILAALYLRCATADVMRLETMPRDASDASKVEVFVDEPTRPYKAIAIVEASDEAWGLSIDTLKAKLVKETAALGGDAVIIGQRVDQGAGASFIPVGNMLVGVNMTEKKLSGKVIVFTDK